MTLEEVEVWRHRLMRIWTPDSDDDDEGPPLLDNNMRFELDGRVIELEVCDWDSSSRPELFSLNHFNLENHSYMAFIRCSSPKWAIEAVCRYSPDTYEAFIERWLRVFRRGCWLSGCPIEATAHEKAEWIQGFTREELEAWNLKM